MIIESQILIASRLICATLLLTLGGLFSLAYSQDARELQSESTSSSKLKGEHPLTVLMRRRKSELRSDLVGIHPRVFVTDSELKQLRERSRTTHRELWQQLLPNIRALNTEPAPPPAQRRRDQNEVGLAIAEAAFAYKIEGDQKYLLAAKKFMDAAVSYDIWGYANNKPNVDLAAGHLLYGLGWGYDLLYNDLTEMERARYRNKLIKQAQLLADYFKPKPGRTFAYSQNHTFIPIAGLGIAAYALYGETPQAAEWARLARAIFDRTLATYSEDGYYYEGFEYWIFSTPWIIHYLDAHLHSTGEDLYDQPGLRAMHKYVAHSMLPSGQYVFDFGDIFEGPLTRAGKGEEYPRTHPGGHFHTNYNLLYRLAQRYKDGDAQGVADWLRSFKQDNAEDFWSLVWYEPGIKSTPIQQQSTSYYFKDHEVVYWRSDWTTQATAFAFKCGPSEGHHTTAMLKQFADWRLSSGHAHPDANSFIVFSRGQYLTGDTGYAGVPMTEHHNTLLFDGHGQAREGNGHDAFEGIDYDRADGIRITYFKLDKDRVMVTGDATNAYESPLGVKKFVRRFEYRSNGEFSIRDDVETSKPSMITSLLHADSGLRIDGDGQYRIDVGSVRLLVEPITPKDLRGTIESNILTAAGPPGAVDKGERQERGQKLLLATPGPVNMTRIELKLRVIPAGQVSKTN